MNFKNLNCSIGAIILVFSLSNCKKEDPVIPHEEEVITTLKYTLTPINGGDSVDFSFQDLDGDGGNAPTTTSEKLAANTSYTGVLTMLNEVEGPAHNITAEVEDEGVDHQLFYSIETADFSISYNDQDVNGKPIGLSTAITTGDVSTGKLTISMRHEPNKTATNVSSGDISNAGGETDIEVTFDVEIE